MNTIFSNKYLKVSVDFEKKYIETIYSKNTEKITEKEFKETLLKITELAQEYIYLGITRHLRDTRNLKFPIYPELQSWIANNSRIINHPNNFKTAIVESDDFFVKLSVEQTVNEVKQIKSKENINIRFFDNLENAQKWLFTEESKS